jgi:hypothetical protein
MIRQLLFKLGYIAIFIGVLSYILPFFGLKFRTTLEDGYGIYLILFGLVLVGCVFVLHYLLNYFGRKHLIKKVKGLLLINLDENNAQSIINECNNAVKILERYSNNSDASDLIRILQDRKAIAEVMKSTSKIDA